MSCPHDEHIAIPATLKICYWCVNCGAYRTQLGTWQEPQISLQMSNEDVSDSLVDKAQLAAGTSVEVLALRVANLVRELGALKTTAMGAVQAQAEEYTRLSKLAERVVNLERDLTDDRKLFLSRVREVEQDNDAYRKRIVKHESLFMDFYKTIAQTLD